MSGANFGCGSSREHAPWALEVNGIYTVIAEGYARIFRQNMFNCGMLAIELPASRMRSLAPTELLARLQRDEGSPLLDTLARQAGRLGVEHRHGSMRHVVAWSWRQLNPPQQDLLRAMALFASPAPVSAIAAVAQLDDDAARDGIEQLPEV